MENQKVVLITGCSSGIGLTTAVYLAEKGCKVYATMRDLKKKDNLMSEAKNVGVSVEVLPLDVIDEKSIKSAIGTIIKKEGRIDALVNNAGYGTGGFLEDFSMDEIKDQFETNVFGLIRVTQAVLPIMRKQHYGYIINISSVGGKIAFPLSPVYAASKFSVEAITESLRTELVSFGIKATAIEPPGVNTNFVSSLKVARKSQDPSSPYYEHMQKYEKRINELSQNSMSVETIAVAKTIHKAITSENPKRSYPVGNAKILLAMRSMLPNSIFEWIVRKMFFG